MMGASSPVYSGYTCYTGISDFTPPDLEMVGYRVFLGNGQVSIKLVRRQYSVSSDVGRGKQQWYCFLCLSACLGYSRQGVMLLLSLLALVCK